jgi:hypothetical protein
MTGDGAAIQKLPAGLAHALNNLLTVVAGNLDMVLEDAVAGRPVSPEMAERALLATRRAIELIDGVRPVAEVPVPGKEE